MMLIDADALEREGWSLCRTFQEDKNTMVYEVKKPSDFPTIEERKTGKWQITDAYPHNVYCSECHKRLHKHIGLYGRTEACREISARTAVRDSCRKEKTMDANEIIRILSDIRSKYNCFDAKDEECYRGLSEAIKMLSAQQWIPCSERLPEDLEEVNVTWVNHDPEPYYNFVKDKPFTATAVYYKEKWYWYSSTCADLLAEYGRNPNQEIDDDIEITAWIPLPEPWKGEEG